jgi:hypothetical protein
MFAQRSAIFGEIVIEKASRRKFPILLVDVDMADELTVVRSLLLIRAHWPIIIEQLRRQDGIPPAPENDNRRGIRLTKESNKSCRFVESGPRVGPQSF